MNPDQLPHRSLNRMAAAVGHMLATAVARKLNFVTAFTIVAFAAGCTSNTRPEIPLPDFITGVSTSSQFSGWGLDWCSNGEPVKNLYAQPDRTCAASGGEIHIIRIRQARSLSDGSALPTLRILVPLAVDGSSPQGMALHVEPAPPELAADTGVKYWARSAVFTQSLCPGERPGAWSPACVETLRRALVDKR